MTATEKAIEIKSTSGATYHGVIDAENNVTCEDVRHEVIEGIEEQAGWGCQSQGKVVVGGQMFSWRIVGSDASSQAEAWLADPDRPFTPNYRRENEGELTPVE